MALNPWLAVKNQMKVQVRLTLNEKASIYVLGGKVKLIRHE